MVSLDSVKRNPSDVSQANEWWFSFLMRSAHAAYINAAGGNKIFERRRTDLLD